MATMTASQHDARSRIHRIRDDWERFSKTREAPEPVRDLREKGIRRFEEVGFPSVREENWRFTNVRPIAETDFTRAEGPSAVDPRDLATYTYEDMHRVVLVDGFFSEEHSEIGELPEGTFVGGLARALDERPELVLPHLGRYADIEKHPFAALNSAFLADGAFVWVPPGAVIETPIQLLYVTSGGAGEAPVSCFPRNLVVAEENSQVLLVENYATLGGGTPFTCAVTEMQAEPAAVVDHYKVQQESAEAFDVALFQIHQERSSNVRSHTVTTGGALVRNDTGVVMDGEGADCTLNGLYVVNGTQLVDNHMWVEHAKPHCHSYELFKGILEDKARAVFNGWIHVLPGAQKTDAKQSSRNLLLSREAMVNANPQLEIFADDVKCTHGSTVGQLDEEAIFYLRSRGIGQEAAESILTYAFASDIVQRIKVEAVREELAEFLFTRLPKGDIVRQTV